MIQSHRVPYAIAKIAGLKLCQAYRRQYGCNFIAVMPTNLYGPNDNFDEISSHVLPALIGRFHRAKVTGQREVVVWGSGTPRREFLHVDDLADACLFLMQHYNGEVPLNIGTGRDASIRELAELIRDIVYPQAEIVFDASKPDGAPRKCLDVSRLDALGWQHRISLDAGIRSTYERFFEALARVTCRPGFIVAVVLDRRGTRRRCAVPFADVFCSSVCVIGGGGKIGRCLAAGYGLVEEQLQKRPTPAAARAGAETVA